jgi:RNA polymerase sigma-70 factor, ECF subfamily
MPDPNRTSWRESDGELLSRIADRDLVAFETLYGRYARPVYGLALRRLNDRGRAEDATHQAFAAIWRSAATFVPARGSGARWLFTIARAAVDHEQVASRDGGPGETPADAWLTFRVHAAVAVLPELEREPLELAYWGRRSQTEIAELLGLPVGTVRTRTRSALARLAVQLDELP